MLYHVINLPHCFLFFSTLFVYRHPRRNPAEVVSAAVKILFDCNRIEQQHLHGRNAINYSRSRITNIL